ncbi:F0F1-type ATP synthase assembly protein I [Psychromicrobium silvestre]|uniref:F0F1-type ATP synthase assembly protein I n=1 Tax=Psychromicrobium silvestre TaxID=1645614 RepID=A0A7Y9S6V0_9MICC|nr:AtpZ/AtpI family protein [Psychromicrobium silvestre]NYE94806.1 F0F1-type ATP synthase assembly protein I [Psychromicrobium silvestre]
MAKKSRTPEATLISAAAGGTDAPAGTNTYNAGMTVFSYIIGGIVVWSLIGWGLDTLFKTHWIVLVGALSGLAGGLYLSFAPRFRSQQVKEDVAREDDRS